MSLDICASRRDEPYQERSFAVAMNHPLDILIIFWADYYLQNNI